jgi:hypothetical protein
MQLLITAIILSVTAITAQATPASDLAVKHIKDAQFALAQCPKGGCTADNGYDLVKSACSSLVLARSYAQQSRDKDLYEIARKNVKNVCGPDY